ncbi:MAG: hypothetical protein WBA93_13900 [Microcoleaceae cyanobacterium]
MLDNHQEDLVKRQKDFGDFWRCLLELASFPTECCANRGALPSDK